MKVVFVDDSKIVLQTLKSMLRDIIEGGNIECNFYSDSVNLQKKILNEELDYDLMFVDINMPMVNGYELVKSAKEIKKYANKPIIAITSEHSESSKKHGKEVGFDGWVEKSISKDSFSHSILDNIKILGEKHYD